jgi:hypothetical protein
VSAAAVPTGTTTSYALSLTIVDSDNATSAASTGTWTAKAAPKITNPGLQAVEPSRSLSLPLTYSCPNATCIWQAAIQTGVNPAWYPVTISTTGVMTYSSMLSGTYLLRAIATDVDGITDTAFIPLTVATFTLPIATQSSTRPPSGTSVVTLDVAALVTPSGADYTYTISGQPSWLTINASTGLLTATLTPTSLTDTSITVTARSVASSLSTVATTFRWNVG